MGKQGRKSAQSGPGIPAAQADKKRPEPSAPGVFAKYPAYRPSSWGLAASWAGWSSLGSLFVTVRVEPPEI